MPIRLVLADDHPIVLDGLEALFRLEHDFQVVARCTDGAAALATVRRHRPDILVLDIHMPGTDGLAVIRELHQERLPTKVVLLAAALNDFELLEALRLGVRGMVLKDLAPQLLVQCVRKVHAGEQWLERHVIGRMLDTLRRSEAGGGGRDGGDLLTPREIELVRMVAGGLRNKEMAKRLAISEGTIKTHLHNIYRKLQVQNRVELVLRAQAQQLVPPSAPSA